METVLRAGDAEGIKEAVKLLQNGQVIGMPTETVYGLAANAFDAGAVEAIFRAKGRPQDNPLIVHISRMEMLPRVARMVSEDAQKLAKAFWPGPLTLVLPKTADLPMNVSAGLDTVGVRMPAHETAISLINACGFPLAAPSANLSGSPSPTTARHVMDDLAGRIPLVLDGGGSPVGVESTVLTLVGAPTVLRPGFVTPQEIEDVLGKEVAVVPTLKEDGQAGFRPPSPGMKYKHYAPKARITIIQAELAEFITYICDKRNKSADVFALCYEDDALPDGIQRVSYGTSVDEVSQAAALFGALRRLDELGAQQVFARCVACEGVGLAVRNRLLRAAAFREIRL